MCLPVKCLHVFYQSACASDMHVSMSVPTCIHVSHVNELGNCLGIAMRFELDLSDSCEIAVCHSKTKTLQGLRSSILAIVL